MNGDEREALGDLQLVQNWLYLLKLGPLVGVSVPAYLNDPLQVMVHKPWEYRPSIVLCNLGRREMGREEGDYNTWCTCCVHEWDYYQQVKW